MPKIDFQPIMAKKIDFQPIDIQPDSTQTSPLQAAAIKGEEGGLLGLRPVVAGLAAAAGDYSGRQNSSLASAIEAFKQGRGEANQEQNLVQQEHPLISTIANLGGSLVTLPMLPAKGLAGAIKLGSGLGLAQAAGSADSLKDAAIQTAEGAGLGAAGFGIGKGATALLSSKPASYLGNKAKDVAKKILIDTPSELTGVPDKEIEAYATRADKINQIISDNKAEGKFDSQLAANHMKDNILNDVKNTRQHLSGQITDALNQASPEKLFPVAPIKNALLEMSDRLHPEFDGDQIQKIKDLMGKLDKVADPSGNMSVQDLQATKEHLYDVASGAYKQSSKFFQIGSEVSNAAKSAGSVAKKILDEHGPVEIRNANRQLSQLHSIEEAMSPSLLDSDKTASSIFSVGAGSNPRDTLALRQLGEATGKNYLQDATDLSAARSFSDPSLFSNFKNGRSLLGTSVGGSIAGAFMGGVPGAVIGGNAGAAIGTIISSPRALKMALDAGRVSGRALAIVADQLKIHPQNFEQLTQALQSPQNQQLLIRAMSTDNQAAAQELPDNAIGRRLKAK